ncbi:MAG: cell division protein ZapE, partial [Gammaproteobacteria bacterium]|nr:cell division protein ZapE [Gammaproteobacteria bacterium]
MFCTDDEERKLMTLQGEYQQQVMEKKIEADPLQQKVLVLFDDFLKEYQGSYCKKWWHFRTHRPFIRGIYLWGSVGIGKTWLMDLFYNQLPGTRKIRQHFHVFMRSVHQRLTALQGMSDPLKTLAK